MHSYIGIYIPTARAKGESPDVAHAMASCVCVFVRVCVCGVYIYMYTLT